MPSVFLDPRHNHARCAAETIAHAEKVCAAGAQRLTPIRRKVLQALAASHKPLGAYDIMGAVTGPRPAPITIYRALEFLIALGLVHRLARRRGPRSASRSPRRHAARVSLRKCQLSRSLVCARTAAAVR